MARMAGQANEGRWTPAEFVPENRKGLHKPNSVDWMVMVTGVALCSVGNWGIFLGAPIALAGFYSGFFLAPKVKRGLYFGACPHCGAAMSATHYQEELGCPSCQAMVQVRDGRFIAG
jgi:hypothetical protein